MSRASKRRSKDLWDGRTYGLKTIGKGISGFVLALENDRLVVKVSDQTPESLRDMKIEREAYQIFSNKCTNITRCYDYNDPRGLILERLDRTVRDKLVDDGLQTADTVLKWSLGAAKGLAFIHLYGVIQGDVGCHNMLLDHNDTVKLCDFSGSSIDGMEATINYETRSRAPFSTDEPDKNDDIFALGSAMYEMCLGHSPYHDRTDREVAAFFANQKFPSRPRHINRDFWAIIEKCWKKEFNGDANMVASQIAALISKPDSSIVLQKETRYHDFHAIVNTNNPPRKRHSRNQNQRTTKSEKRQRQRDVENSFMVKNIPGGWRQSVQRAIRGWW